MIAREALAALLPHAGSMLLLERVVQWDADSIHCRASSHRDLENPLAIDGALDAACGVEYAAQAMAIHGGLLAAGAARPTSGYLASLRALTLHCQRLDRLAEDLDITAVRLVGDRAHVSYQFSVDCAGRTLMEGRATVRLDSEPL